MNKENNKISIKQLVTIFLLGTASPGIRVVPKYVVEIAGKSAWLTSFVTIIPIIILITILSKLINKTKLNSLEEVFNKIIGKRLGKALSILYIIWLFIITTFYLRYFAERFISTILIFTPIQFFLITILCIVYFVCQKEIKFFARFTELFWIAYILVLIFTLVVSIPQLKITNFLPITTGDIKPIIYSTYPLLGIWSYMTIMFFLGDNVSNIQDFKKTFKFISKSLLLMGLIATISTIGVFGAKLTEILNMPFFVVYKNIKILIIIERIEAILISSWTIVDFIIITSFVYVIIRLIKKTFKLSSSKEIVCPTVFILYIFAQFIASNIFELNNFSKQVFLPINILFGMLVPICIYIVGKVRKMI